MMEVENAGNKAKNIPCRINQRYILCALSFVGLVNVGCLRSHVSVTVLAMVNNTGSQLNCSEKDGLTWSSLQQGQFLGSNFYGYFIGNLPCGLLIKKFGFKNVYFLSILIAALIEIFIPLASYHYFYLAIFLRAVSGFLQASSYPANAEMWSKWAPPLERNFLNSVAITGTVFGIIISIPLTGIILNNLRWEAVFYIFSGFSIFWSILFFFLITETPETHPRISEQEKMYIYEGQIGRKIECKTNISIPWKSIITSKCFLAYLPCHFAEAWYQLTVAALFPTYMVKALNYEVLETSFVMIIPNLSQFIVALLFCRISDVVRTKGYLSTTNIRKVNSCTGIGLAALLLALSGYVGGENVNGIVAIIIVGYAISGMMYGGHLTNVLDFAPNFASIIFSLSNTFASSSGFLSPITAAAIVQDQTSKAEWQKFFWLTFGISFFGITIYGLFASGNLQKWSIKEGNEEDMNENKIDNKLLLFEKQ